jgi:hypothetical protein
VTTPLRVVVVEWLVFNLTPCAKRDHSIREEIREAESRCEWSPGACCQDKRISEEITKNCYLQRELDMLKHERTRETWPLQNDLRNLENANSKLQKQLEEQQTAHQEQLKE